MFNVTIHRDVYGDQRVRFVQDVELPFPPFVGLWLVSNQQRVAVRIDKIVRLDLDEQRFYCEMDPFVSEDETTAREQRIEMVEWYGWRLFGINSR